MIYDRVNKYTFRDAFMQSDNLKNNFTYEGLGALYDYLEDFSEQTGEDIELDPCGIASDFTEYKSLKEFRADYGEDYSIEDIEAETTVIHFDGGFIVFKF